MLHMSREMYGYSWIGSLGQRRLEPNSPVFLGSRTDVDAASQSAIEAPALAEIKTGRIRELDGWRGISILTVIFGHCWVYRFSAATEHSPKFLMHFAWHADEGGVCVFFVISGFVITRLLLSEEKRNGSISIRSFYTRRFFRIIPVFYLLLFVVSVSSMLHIIPSGLTHVLAAGLFLRDTKIGWHDWFTGHTWSLAVEEQFYLGFPLFLLLSKPRHRSRWMGFTLVLFLLWSFLAQYAGLTGVFLSSAIVGFSCINVGVLLAMFEPDARRLAASLHPAVALLAGIFVFYPPFPTVPLGNAIHALLVPFCIATMLMYTISQKGWAASVLKSGPVQWVGLVSYSAYLWQQLFTAPLSSYGISWGGAMLSFALLLVPIVAISYYCVERPCMRLGRRFSASEAGKG